MFAHLFIHSANILECLLCARSYYVLGYWDIAVNKANIVFTMGIGIFIEGLMTSDLNLYIMHSVYHGKYFVLHF